MKKNFIPVLLGSDINVYSLAREFYEQYHIKSYAFCVCKLAYTEYSRIIHVKEVPNFDQHDIFLNTLINFAKKAMEKQKKLILIGCNDEYVKLCIENVKILQKYYIIPYVNKNMRENLDNKESFYQLCNKYNIDYPKTLIVTPDNYKDVEIPFDFPVAVKVTDSIDYAKLDFDKKKKAYKCNTKKEMMETIELIYNNGYHDKLIIQEFIPGDDNAMFVINGYSSQDGKVRFMALGNIVFGDYIPHMIGNYNAIISAYDKELIDKFKNFLEKIKFVGFSNFDLKYDYRDKKFKVFEMNIRQGRSHFFVTAAGYNIVKYLVDDYIYNDNKECIYAKNEHLCTQIKIKALKKYIKDEKVLARINKLVKAKKYSHTLFYKKDRNPLRILKVNLLCRAKDKQQAKAYEKHIAND